MAVRIYVKTLCWCLGLWMLSQVGPASQILRAQQPGSDYQTEGVRDNLPIFLDNLKQRTTHPLSWLSGRYMDFGLWKTQARGVVMEALLLPPPPAPFEPLVIGEEDRGSYVAQRVVLNISGDSRVLGYLLIPKGAGPFPGALLLHDHSGRFDIGKEKMVRPFDATTERRESAEQFVGEKYSGRYVGDELARRGYLCFITDALNWGDRAGAWSEGQQALNSNLMHFGMSLGGLIAHEDLRAAEFLASQPKVDRDRVAAVGLSMGSFRTWQVSALSDHIAAGVAICWMTTLNKQTSPGLNATRGSSKYTMLHPGLFHLLDYPDIASLACPKPMLFYNGLQDRLFPIDSVHDAYRKLHRVWVSQGVEDRLETRMWDVPHVFDSEMQTAAFGWLDRQIERLADRP